MNENIKGPELLSASLRDLLHDACMLRWDDIQKSPYYVSIMSQSCSAQVLKLFEYGFRMSDKVWKYESKHVDMTVTLQVKSRFLNVIEWVLKNSEHRLNPMITLDTLLSSTSNTSCKFAYRDSPSNDGWITISAQLRKFLDIVFVPGLVDKIAMTNEEVE